MKSVKQHNLISRLTFSSLIFLFFFTLNLSAQGDAVNGKKLFNANCAACHKLDKNVIGPKLGGMTEVRENAWLKAWIIDNAALQKTDADAREAAKFSPTSMMAFPQFSDQELDDILEYTANPPQKKAVVTLTGSEGATTPVKKNNTLLYILGAIMLVMLLMIFNLYRTITEMKDDLPKRASFSEQAKAVWKAFKRNTFLHFLMTIFFVLLGVWVLFGWFMQMDVNQGYQPIQPIKFSHKIHAGDNKIDCQYCHSSAKNSKTSGIPSANVCMNCHKSISEVADDTAIGQFGKDVLDKEIQKLYDAVGWDSENLKYTGETKPIEWIRVHNLADFVYYNHSQHVNIAGISCQKCHGPVEEMDEVYQFSPLTMDWCISCHRETEVDMTESGYYKKVHEQLAKKYGVKKVTVAEMGGMECGKCHY
ncbi:MAG: c-type cytochrome [Flavobacteriaceae bacterium]|nr:c-type cytochrome [Flavobacteriaceae bacterium]